MTVVRAAAIGLAVALVGLAGCSSGSNLEAEDPTRTPSPTFIGDADSAFCRRAADHAADPAPDPFEADLGPGEIEARLARVVDRVDELAAVSPEDLDRDLDDLQAGLAQLRAALDEVDYDFGALAGSDADLSVVNDPRFAGISERIDRYQRQVCHLDP